jgi:hypothetical protein
MRARRTVRPAPVIAVLHRPADAAPPSPSPPSSRRPRVKVLVLTAKLTASGTPVSGQPIAFSTGNTPLCTPDTSAATCTLTAAQTLLAENDNQPIQASYPGTANYQPSSATMTPP